MRRFFIYTGQEISASSLGLFRILFGLVLLMQILNWGLNDFVEEDLVRPALHYKFYFFSFLEPLSPSLLQLLMVMLGISAVMISLGILYRAVIGFWFVGFTYLWLLDKGFFNNHYYLISIFLGMMFFVGADRWNPFRKGGMSGATVPRWQVWALCAQVFIVFLWGGLNKLQAGWLLNHQPIHYILEYKAQFTGEGFWDSALLENMMIWGGLLFDLLVIPALIWRKTRVFALAGMVLFNGFNFWVFHDVGGIGIFPWFVLATTVLFFPPDTGDWLLYRIGRPSRSKKKSKSKPQTPSPALPSRSRIGAGNNLMVRVFTIFLLFQLLFPARHFLIPGNVDWTGEGQRFAWRMKIFYKDFEMHWYMVDRGGEGERYEVDLGKLLTPKQYTALAYYPDLIPPTARYLKADASKKGLQNPVIHLDFVSGLNGWPRQQLLNPDLDASGLSIHPFRRSEWIIPYRFGAISPLVP